jgi:sec-independent protein translocase protein TatA
MILIASIMNLAGPDLIIILLIILVLFGAKKLPELARGMGQAVKEFQKAKDEFSDELHKADKANTTAAQPTVQPAPATIARVPETPSAPTPATTPDPNQIRPPGDEVGPV